MMYLSCFSEEIIIWNSNEYQFTDLDDTVPQALLCLEKKNPDIAELVRGKQAGYMGL